MTPKPKIPADTLDAQMLARQLYDLLMARIEPDLTMANIPSLDAKYAKETEAEKAARLKRYEAAYARFNVEFAECMGAVQQQVHQHNRAEIAHQESASKSDDQTAVSSIESAFN